jgi:hypothetical protein
MTFTSQFQEKIKKDSVKMELALKLGVSYMTIIRRLKIHKDDEITKPKYLKVLSEVTGVAENEIFLKDEK